MNIELVREYCLKKKAVTECFPFDKNINGTRAIERTLVFKVMDKMFALVDLVDADSITLKCEPEYAIELRETYETIQGAWHFNKKYWNDIGFDPAINDTLIYQLIDHSYNEVIKKFTKKQRAQYDAIP